MVATDTVVGIVGAVLLVAVMAGVFAYEYNNPVEDDSGTDGGRRAAFAAGYPGLSADDDVDGDGQPNYEDGDLDGDGTPNEADSDVTVRSEASGAIGPAAGPSNTPFEHRFTVGNGTEHIEASVTAAAAIPNPLFSGNFVFQLVRPDGTVADDQASSPGGPSTFTLQTQEGDEIPPGTWIVRVTQNQAGPGGSVSLDVEVHYPDPAAEHHAPEK